MPASAWNWRQVWHDLLFMHWPVPPETLRPLVPAPLELDTREGVAWLGLIPFWMSGVTLRGLPALPWLSSFSEMNLRTYVTLGGRPGVFFLRMDASRALAVWAARASLGLPYVWSRMRVRQRGDSDIDYSSRCGGARFDATYGSTGPVEIAAPESLAAFLTERYCLFTRHRRRLLRVDVHHASWPLQPASIDIRENTIPESCGLPPPGERPLVHFSRRLDVVGWSAVDAYSNSSIAK